MTEDGLLNDYVGTGEAARELNVEHRANIKARALYTAILNGTIPAVRLRGRWYLSRRDYPAIIRVMSQAAPRRRPSAA